MNTGGLRLLVGLTDTTAIVHDPYFTSNRGAYREWPLEVMMTAWGGYWQQNTLVPDRPVVLGALPPAPVRPTARVNTPSGLRLRAGPGTNYPILSGLGNGWRLEVTGKAVRDGQLWLRVITHQGRTGWCAGWLCIVENLDAAPYV